MKKILLSALMAMAAVSASPLTTLAQTCPTAPNVVTVQGGTNNVITTNTTWTSNNIYLLNGIVYVDNGAVLTIEPGTIIKGDFANKGTLVIRRGARIEANGTAARPIVFTSNREPGLRNRGDWGGIIICGRAAENIPGDPLIEGGNIVANYGPGQTNGVDNPAVNNDNSGTLRYVRIEFCGVALITGNEVNGLTMGGVGSGTTIDHIQVSYSGDDSFEWFGGTVNAKYLVALGGLDDDFDVDNGFQGRVQYGLVVRDPAAADQSQSNGFESDNDGTGTNNSPRTEPTFSNISIFLPGTPTPNTLYRRAMHLRRNSATSIFNSVFAGPYPVGLNLEEGSTAPFPSPNSGTNLTNGQLVLKNNVLAGQTAFFQTATGSTLDLAAYWTSNANTTETNIANLGLNGDNFALTGNCSNAPCVPAFQLPTASSLNTGAAFADAKLTGAGNGGPNSAFDVVTYRGAFGTTNWAAGWTNFNPQNTCYNRPGQTLSNRNADEQVQGLSVAPNPTEGAAKLSFELKKAGAVTVRVLDVTGREVAVVTKAVKLAAGTQVIELPASLNAGLYLASVTTENGTQSVRFVVAK